MGRLSDFIVRRVMEFVRIVTKLPVRHAAKGPSGWFLITFRLRNNRRTLILGQISTVPPTAAESLKESRGVGIAIGLGLNEIYHGLLIALLRA